MTPTKYAPDHLLPRSGFQALKVILDKNEDPLLMSPWWFRLIHWGPAPQDVGAPEGRMELRLDMLRYRAALLLFRVAAWVFPELYIRKVSFVAHVRGRCAVFSIEKLKEQA